MKNLFKPVLISMVLSLITLISSLFTSLAYADVETGWMSSPQHPPARTRFVVTGQVDQANHLVEGFLEIELSGDWKTYWRSPGEGGVAPNIDWRDSTNLNSVDWHWPYPEQFDLLGIHTLGYKGDTVIPMTLHIKDWSKPVDVRATLTLSSCTSVCVLTDYSFDLTFNPSQLSLSESGLFQYAKALSQVPKASPLIQSSQAIWDSEKQILEVRLDKPQGWTNPEFIVDGATTESQEYSYKLISAHTEQNFAIATFEVSSWLGNIALEQQSVNIVVKDNNFLAEQRVVVSPGIVQQNSNSIGMMLGFALLGGLILNIMPCVLPVLGMKLSSILSTKGLQRREVRLQFIASSAGIIASFWALAGFLLVLKFTGSAVGWGIQFQTPWFIGLMIAITILFGCNMLGLFEIRLSSGTNTWLASKGGSSYLGHFIQGALATLLATPCSAPFLGTAVAFALGASNFELIVIFTALAVGMALPWIVVAIFPGIAAWLPKPGAWMNKIKILFGIMMLGTSIWLLYLLANHLPIFWILLIALVAFIYILIRIKRVYSDKAMVFSASAVLLLTAGSLVIGSMTAEHWAMPLPQYPPSKPLSNELIQRSVSEGKTVFVNVTADWCVTCKANKIGVILQEPVYSAIQAENVVNIKGDWTHRNKVVTDYLHQHGRYGIPFTIVYGPNAPQGIPLPIILTDDDVIKALNLAGKGSTS